MHERGREDLARSAQGPKPPVGPRDVTEITSVRRDVYMFCVCFFLLFACPCSMSEVVPENTSKLSTVTITMSNNVLCQSQSRFDKIDMYQDLSPSFFTSWDLLHTVSLFQFTW